MAGLALAAPIAAVGIVVTRTYYLRDVLGEPAEAAENGRGGVGLYKQSDK